MRDRFLASLHTLAIVVVLASVVPVPVVGQSPAATGQAKKAAATNTWSPPLTPYGQPDLQGVWVNSSATPLERPDALAGRALLTDEEVKELQQRADRLFKYGNSDFAGGDSLFQAALTNPEQYKDPIATAGSDAMVERKFDNRTSLIVDPPEGKVPALTTQGRQRLGAALAAAFRDDPDRPEDLSNFRRCLTAGVPRLGPYGTGPYSYLQIFQSPGHVTILMEFIHEARIIPVDGRGHLPQRIRQLNGDSIGSWEGNTLVVDTTNFSPQARFMGSAENLHLVERFTRVAADTINYEITLDDATTWTKRWTVAIRLTHSRDQLYEAACHEENFHSMRMVLGYARAKEKTAAEAAQSPK